MGKWGKNMDMKDIPDFGPIIKRLRLDAGMTQEDLCAATDYVLQNGYLSQLERKPKAISFMVLNAICKALNVSVSDMLRELEGGEPTQTLTHKDAVVRDSRGNRTESVIPVTANLPSDSYAIRVENSTMEAPAGISYYKGGYVIIAPCSKAESGNDYVFLIDDQLVLARYDTDGRRHLLSYLNPAYPKETLSSEPDVKGRIVGFYFSNYR